MFQNGPPSAIPPAGLQTIIEYAWQQSLIPRKIAPEELFDDITALEA